MRRLRAATAKAAQEFTAALANDLNTAEARAAIFEMVRAANSAADAGTLGAENAARFCEVLTTVRWRVCGAGGSRCGADARGAGWAEREGRTGRGMRRSWWRRWRLTDAEIEALVEERTQAKKARNFARADAIRAELTARVW